MYILWKSLLVPHNGTRSYNTEMASHASAMIANALPLDSKHLLKPQDAQGVCALKILHPVDGAKMPVQIKCYLM